MTLARRTRVNRPEPEETLVDRVAAVLAFFPDIFEPVALEEYTRDGRLTLATIDRVRERIVPDASREATARACLQQIPTPAWLLRCGMGLNAKETRELNNPQMSFFPKEPPETKLRLRAAVSSLEADALGIRFHPNMRIPDTSIVTQAFHSSEREPVVGVENLEAWETSLGGSVGAGPICIEAERVGNDEVWALVCFMDAS